MKTTDWILTGCCMLILTLTYGWVMSSPQQSGPISLMMDRLHTYSAKLGHSVQARNQRLAGFYVHEIEELVEELVTTVPTYDGHAVGELARSIALPAVEQLESAVAHGEWSAVDASYRGLIASCNSCHSACGKEFVRIAPVAGLPPFNQRFLEAVAAPVK